MIALVGFMGAGKTAVGTELANIVGLPFLDTDELIEAAEGRRIAEIFTRDGEAYFRDRERAIVLGVLGGADAVVALGGGAIQDPEVRTGLAGINVVYLETDLDECLRRIDDPASRPMLGIANIPRLYRERASLYGTVADRRVPTAGRTPREVAQEIANEVTVGSGMRSIAVELGERSYEVVVGAGILERVRSFLPSGIRAGKAFVVTHPRLVEGTGAISTGLKERRIDTVVLEVPEGESSKSWERAGSLLQAIAQAEGHRGDLVIGFGGGVITDLAGFVASTYARGIDVVHVPTTLLGQVDAAIGGKTGVNLPEGKNLAGSFHQPRGVLCDVELLAGLPDAEFRSGMAEVLKYGFIADPAILRMVTEEREALDARDPAALIDVVTASVRVKAAIVSSDEREGGVRAHLNYGHTFAHAIEQTSGYGTIRHGEAVALGMMAAAHVAAELGWIDDGVVAVHRRTLEAAGLPVGADLRYEDLAPAWLRDKKYDQGVRFVLLEALGKPRSGVAVDRPTIEAALERMAT